MGILFKIFGGIQVWLYRVSGGKLGGKMAGFKVLLLTTVGRKSGKIHTVPLGFFERQGGYLIVASKGGAPSNPAWYYNLKDQPQVTVQIYEMVMPASVEVLSGEARAQAWQQVISEAPSYAAYEKRTTREIPLILLRPVKKG